FFQHAIEIFDRTVITWFATMLFHHLRAWPERGMHIIWPQGNEAWLVLMPLHEIQGSVNHILCAFVALYLSRILAFCIPRSVVCAKFGITIRALPRAVGFIITVVKNRRGIIHVASAAQMPFAYVTRSIAGGLESFRQVGKLR